MSFTLLGILNSQASGVAQTYFLSVLGGASAELGNGVSLDSDNNAYVAGSTTSTGAGDGDFLLAKYDNVGAVQWQRTLGGANYDSGNGVATDSVGDVYVVGETRSQGAGVADLTLAKYNSSGTIQWQRILGGAGFERGRSVAIDSVGDVYVFGRTPDGFLFAKYNSSGTLQWQRVLDVGLSDFGYSVAIDSADDIYVAGLTFIDSSNALLAKYDSSGTIQWQRTLDGAGSDIAYSVAIDSSDNVYFVGSTSSTGAGSDDLLLAKYNSSGTIQWQRILGGASGDKGYSVAIDSADHVYVLGLTASTGAGSNDFLLAKYNSSGTIQFQRVLGGASSDEGHSVAFDSADNVYVFGFTESTGAGSNDFLLAKLPNDGSLEGTYLLAGATFIYQASSLTAATSTLTAATSTGTSSSASLTSAISTLTDATATLTSVTEEIG